MNPPTDAAKIFVHPSAVVEAGATLGAGVRIGPFCHVGGAVELGPGVELLSHVVIAGRTRIGADTRVFPFASIGHAPQDLKYRGEPSSLEIGAECIIREGVTISPGTEAGGMLTRIGDRCAFLANAHVGHDCRIGNHVVLSNNVMIAGHVTIGDWAAFGGGAAVIQFTRVGAHAFLGGVSGLDCDLIPYGLALGNRAHLAGLNLVGLKRRGFSRETINEMRRAYRLLFAADGTLQDRVAAVAKAFAEQGEVSAILDFLKAAGERAVCMPDHGREPSDGLL
jgi:UDP-N-acetylglucosamine acyltransferase